MIKSVTVTNYLGDSIVLNLSRPEESGFIVKSITGLGPVKATINASEISTGDGTLFNSSRLSSRNIVISLLFMWKESIEDVRQLSYKFFPIKQKITLVVETDNRTASIEGYVESNEPNIFSKEEETDISIICPDPLFYSVYGENIATFGAIEPLFEFPFSNESLIDPLLEFSSINNRIERNIIYTGDYETGINIHIKAGGEVGNILIYYTTKRQIMKIYADIIAKITGHTIKKNDEIIINTVKGKKSCMLIRSGKIYNILNSMDKTSDWFQISKGPNVFTCEVENKHSNIEVEIRNRIVYEGV